MTVSGTNTFELTRDEIIRRAYQLAGALDSKNTPTGDDIAMASDILGMELDYLQAQGVLLRSITYTTQAVTSGTASYTLPGDTIDVMVEPDNRAGQIWQTAGSETVVRNVTRADYDAISNKTATGTPTLALIQKLASVTLTLWPVPDASMTFRYSKVSLLDDMSTGAATLDLARKWQKPITYTLAWQLALAKGVELNRVGFLKNQAEEMRQVAMSDERQRGDAQLAIFRWGY